MDGDKVKRIAGASFVGPRGKICSDKTSHKLEKMPWIFDEKHIFFEIIFLNG